MDTETPSAPIPNRTSRAIIAAVCEGTGISVEDVLGPRRFARIVEVRHRAMRQIRAEKGWGPERIRKAFGLRDHNCVHVALRKSDRVLDDLRPIRRPPGYVPPGERAALASRIDRMLAHQRVDKGDMLSAHVPIYPIPDHVDHAMPVHRSASSMRGDERRQLARLLFVHGPRCFARYEIDTSAPNKGRHNPSCGKSKGNQHSKSLLQRSQESTKEFAGVAKVFPENEVAFAGASNV